MSLFLISKKFLRCFWNEEAVRRISLCPLRFNEDESSKKSPAAKLNSLLQEIIQDEKISADDVKKVSAEDVIPKKKIRPEKPKDLGAKIVDSAKKIAETLDGKPEETEAQLLHRLLFKNRPLTENIVKAMKSEALKDLLSGMNIERTPISQKKPFTGKEFTRTEQVQMMVKKKTSFRPPRNVKYIKNVNIFGEKPLGIFKQDESTESEVSLETWEAMEKRELHLLGTHPPANIYEQMIQWTERGILWKFPINNEQGLEEVETSDFTEHVFLERHLESWCPEKGPIRHFMELVCVGLSQNHWLTAEEKKQHILWYKDYFTEKKALLQELEAGEIKVVASN